MTCCEGCTSCNGFSLLALLLFGVVLNAIPLIVNRVEEGRFFQNPISCFEWWFPGIVGAGLLVVPATTASLGARKRACFNNKTGMFFSSLLSVLTVLGAMYCIVVSMQALSQGPLICSSPGNSNSSCEFAFDKLRITNESFDLQWFSNESCVLPSGLNPPTMNNTTANGRKPYDLHFRDKETKHKTIHLSVFSGLLIVGILELLFGVSQIIIGFLGCLCGVSKRRSQIV